jgi:hypothetical protein
MKDSTLQPRYKTSRALIIGINRFQKAPPLEYATSDASAIKDALPTQFGFSVENIIVLTDDNATRRNIMSAYMALTADGTDKDDRLLVFYAGHGITRQGTRGDVGFLVPHDGDPDDLSTLIRWDELTLNAELIKAKHILFIMDACYGGLALSRAISAGSMRFLKDMLLRPVRQVITAGKADEAVADAGGPRPKHSVFTGHLLDALEGQAAAEDGVITANGVMSYVYENVSKDIHSRQTPHFGFFDGDGDFVFKAPILDSLSREDTVDKDVLITVPSTEIPEQAGSQMNLVDRAKEYMSDPSAGIKLHDLGVLYVRKYLVETSLEKFPVQGVQFSDDEFRKRLERYETLIRDLKLLASCIAHWGQASHITVMQKVVGRVTDNLLPENGLVVWNALRWYPIVILSYSAGIAAIAAHNYDSLLSLFASPVSEIDSRNGRGELIWSLGEAIVELERSEAFKRLPGHERNYVPRSEYLLKLLQPDLDDVLFLGRAYESLFDEYEVMMALSYADLRVQKGMHLWGPVGRFGWKYHSRLSSESPLANVIQLAKQQGSAWGPLAAGFFGGSVDRFEKVAAEFEERIKKLNWM